MLKTKQIEAYGFWLGTLDAATTNALAEIAAHFAQQIEKVTARFATRLSQLQADVNILNDQKAKAASLWAGLKTETNGRAPQVVLPMLAVATAFLLWLGETYLLSPVLDGMGITDPLEQKFVASVVVLAAATLLEVAAQLIRKPRSSWALRIICLLLSGSTLLSLGWWRGAELIYAAALGSGALQSFLSRTEGLTTIVITLLTMILPLGATLALDWGLSQVRYAREWRRAKRADKRLTSEYERTVSALNALRIKSQQETKVLSHRRDEFTSAFQQAYELGQITGARRLPLWQLLSQIFAAGVAIAAGVIIAAYLFIDPWLAQTITTDIARLGVYLLAAAGAASVYAGMKLKAWYRPTPQQLYEQLTPVWRTEFVPQTQPIVNAARTFAQAENPLMPEPVFESGNHGAAETSFTDDDDEITQVSPRAA